MAGIFTAANVSEKDICPELVDHILGLALA